MYKYPVKFIRFDLSVCPEIWVPAVWFGHDDRKIKKIIS